MNNKVLGIIIPVVIMVVGVWGLSYVDQPLHTYIDLALIILSAGWCLCFYFKWRLEYYLWARQMLLLSYAMTLFYLWSYLLHYFTLSGIYGLAARVISTLLGIVLIICLFTFDLWKPKRKKAWTEFSVGELISWYIWTGKNMEKWYLSDQDETEKIRMAGGEAMGVYLELKRRGQDWRLRDFLKYKDNGVKFLAARHLLWTAEADSLKVLEELGKLQNDLGEDARDCVKAWHAKQILPDEKFQYQPVESNVIWKNILNIGAIVGTVVVICLAAYLVYLDRTYEPSIYSGVQINNPVELSNFVMSSIQAHGSSTLGLFYASSSTTYWGTQDGYLVPLGGWYQVYSPYFHTLTDATTSRAVANLTQYANQLLVNYGFQPDPYNTSTSTDNGPFYRLRKGFVSSDGVLHCVMQSPQRWQYLSQWYFQCALTHDITATLQDDMPYLKALGYPKGAAVFPSSTESFAKVDVGNEIQLFYSAILIKKGGEWNAIYTVSGLPPCSLMEQYAVPQSVFGSCRDANTI